MLGERYGWSVSPPAGYDLISSGAAEGFVFLRRTQPDRNLFVFWREGADLATKDLAVSLRQELTRRYYDGDQIEWQRPFEADTVSFAGRTAVRLSGWWANERLLGGGPFRTLLLHGPGAESPLHRGREACSPRAWTRYRSCGTWMSITRTFAAPAPEAP